MRGSADPGVPLVRFRFEGRTLTAPEGVTVAAALTAHGLRVFGRSSKFHRPRGVRCGNGTCSCCAMRVDGLPGVRTCITPVREGMAVEREGGWPSAGADLGRAAELAAPLLHAGFYYSWFRRSPRAWHVAERVLARAAGQTALPEREAAARLLARARLERVRGGVVVTGGGVAGMSAAVAAAGAGAPTLLVERHPLLGGRAVDGPEPRRLRTRVGELARGGGLRVLTGAEVAGWYEEGVLAVVAGDDLLLVEPAAVVLATGVHERIPPFRGGDLPGVLACGAARRLLRCGALARRRALVVTDRDDGYVLAAELAAGGVEVVAVADLRAGGREPLGSARAATGPPAPVFGGVRDLRAHGRVSVRAATLALEGPGGAGRRCVRLTCDLVCVAAGGLAADELVRQALAAGAFVLEPVVAAAPPAADGVARHRLPGGVPLLLAGTVCGSVSSAGAAAAGEAAGSEAAQACASTSIPMA